MDAEPTRSTIDDRSSSRQAKDLLVFQEEHIRSTTLQSETHSSHILLDINMKPLWNNQLIVSIEMNIGTKPSTTRWDKRSAAVLTVD